MLIWEDKCFRRGREGKGRQGHAVGRRAAVIAKGSGYVRGAGARGRLGAHLKYIEHRAKSERETRNDRRILDAEHDVVNRGDAV